MEEEVLESGPEEVPVSPGPTSSLRDSLSPPTSSTGRDRIRGGKRRSKVHTTEPTVNVDTLVVVLVDDEVQGPSLTEYPYRPFLDEGRIFWTS